MSVVAARNERYCARVLDAACIGMDSSVQLRRSAQHQDPQKSSKGETTEKSTRGCAGLHRSRVSGDVPESATYFLYTFI